MIFSNSRCEFNTGGSQIPGKPGHGLSSGIRCCSFTALLSCTIEGSLHTLAGNHDVASVRLRAQKLRVEEERSSLAEPLRQPWMPSLDLPSCNVRQMHPFLFAPPKSCLFSSLWLSILLIGMGVWVVRSCNRHSQMALG